MNNQPLSVSFAPYTRPTFASSTPPSNHLQITNVGQIPHILRELRADPNRANQITDVIIDEADWVEGDVEGDEGATPRAQEALSPSSTDSKSNDEVDTGSEIDNLDNDEAGATVAELLDEARSHNALQSFQWTGPNPWREGHRPRVFWDALWKSAATLKAVNLQFFEHELYYLHKYQEGVHPICFGILAPTDTATNRYRSPQDFHGLNYYISMQAERTATTAHSWIAGSPTPPR